MDSTLRSNVSVGPPIELLKYETDSLVLGHYLSLGEFDPMLVEIRTEWNERISRAFAEMPGVRWTDLPERRRFN